MAMKILTAFDEMSDRTRSAWITGGFHAAILLLGLLPITRDIMKHESFDEYSVPIEFAEFAQSSDEGLMAASEVVVEETKPVTEQETEEVDIVNDETIEDVAQLTEEVEEIQSDVVDEASEEVVASETEEANQDEVTAAEAGQEATAEEGNTLGNDIAGEDEGQSGLDGDGVITRQVIYRANISEAAYESGQIVVDICINRQGKILTAANNTDNTTIDDMRMVRDVLELVTRYRFETDYSAALRECGRITFIFDVDNEGMGWSDAVEAYAAVD